MPQQPFACVSPYAEINDMYGQYPTFSPGLSTFSCNTSPNSFSPLSLPVQSFDNTPYFALENWAMTQQSPPSYVSAPTDMTYADALPTLPNYPIDQIQAVDSLNWDNFAMQGFSGTTPPTPEGPVPSQQPRTEVQVPAQEDDGEILVGMGLYDAPEKYSQDPQLLHARSSMSCLLGGKPEPAGKGLKLEETWEPPESDEEDDNDDDKSDDDEEECSPQETTTCQVQENWIWVSFLGQQHRKGA